MRSFLCLEHGATELRDYIWLSGELIFSKTRNKIT